MTTSVVLPPGVSLELYEALPKSTLYFDGEGQAGNWGDAGNWWKGTVPNSTSLVLVPLTATLNGSFTAQTVMFLGAETVTINGTLTSTNPNTCESFMVCDDAVAVFDPGSALLDAGDMIVGNDDDGTLTATGTGSSGTTLSSLDGQIGRLDGGIGSVTLNDAKWNDSTNLVVGLEGSGTLSVTHGGVVSAVAVTVGVDSGACGDIALTNGGTLNASSSLCIGAAPGAAGGSGTGTVTVGAASLVTVGSVVVVRANETLALAGGSLTMGPHSASVDIMAGGTLSGFGTVSAVGNGLLDSGTISATGGTLVLDSDVHYSGVLTIGTASTAFVNGAVLGGVAVEFTGTGGTLELSSGIVSTASIYDFAVGDSIVMAGVNAIGWDAAHDVLVLKNAGQTVDRLQLVGNYATDHFTISQGAAGAVIGLMAGH